MNTYSTFRAVFVAASLLIASSAYAGEGVEGPSCHGATAASYEQQAQAAAAKAESHEQMARTYRNSGKTGHGMVAHCERLSKKYREEEAVARAKAAEAQKEGGCDC